MCIMPNARLMAREQSRTDQRADSVKVQAREGADLLEEE
jgi:hypothetical protein